MNQRIVYINRMDDVIIVQDKCDDVYQDTLENFAIDHGTEVPGYINKLDICIDTGLQMLNGARIEEDTPNGQEAIAYANSLIPLAKSLFDIQYARMNPPKPEPPAPTEEELALQAKEKEIAEAKAYLNDTDYAVIKCMELGIDLDAEYPGLKSLRQQARDKVNAAEAERTVMLAAITEEA